MTAVVPRRPHGGVRVWRGRAPAGAPATSSPGYGGLRRVSRYGGRVEPNPASEWQGGRVERSAGPADGAASAPPDDPDDRRRRRRRNLLTCGVFFLALCLVSGVVGFVLY